MKPTTDQEKQVGRKLLQELDALIYPTNTRPAYLGEIVYVVFDSIAKEDWEAFRKRWGDEGGGETC